MPRSVTAWIAVVTAAAWLLVAAGLAVAASLVAAVATIGTPGRQRLLRLDERRVHDLAQLRSAVDAHFETEGRLPASLDELARLTEKEGRDPTRLTISFKAPVYDTALSTTGPRRAFSGTPGQMLDDIGLYERTGVSELIFDFRSEGLAETLERMEGFAAFVKPQRTG